MEEVVVTPAPQIEEITVEVEFVEPGPRGDKGWSPVYIDEVFGEKVIRRLADYINGEGVKPTANVGEYLTDGGFTADKALATNYKGEMLRISFELDERMNLIVTTN